MDVHRTLTGYTCTVYILTKTKDSEETRRIDSVHCPFNGRQILQSIMGYLVAFLGPCALSDAAHHGKPRLRSGVDDKRVRVALLGC